MCRLVESIKILNGRCYNLYYHEQRIKDSLLTLYNYTFSNINLKKIIKIPLDFQKGLVKCRIIYDFETFKVEFSAYTPKIIKKIQLVEIDEKVDYARKYETRTDLDDAYSKRNGADEIIMVKNGYITDAYYYSVLFKNDDGIFTPDTPLLKGTMRQKLIDGGKIKEKQIKYDDLSLYTHVMLVNALNPYKEKNWLDIGEIKSTVYNIGKSV